MQNQLIDMMSIGTLLAYTIVCVCVVVLRYADDDSPAQYEKRPASTGTILRQLLNINCVKQPNSLTSNIAILALVAYCFSTIILCILIDVDREYGYRDIMVYVLIALMLILAVFVARQPQRKCDMAFKVPLVPFLPFISIFLNLYLMCQLDIHTWIRFAIWLVIGYVIFFSYSMRSSVEGHRVKVELSEHGPVDKVTNQTNGLHHGHSNMAYVSDGTNGAM